jgi:MFS family permease
LSSSADVPSGRKVAIPGTVVTLGIVSFFTDLSSEMIYPLLPYFLSQVLGAGAVALGFIEGVAESTAAILKLVSGVLTDRSRRRKPLIIAGYALAGFVRPLIGFALVWPFVLAMRFLDRVGKGLRTSPRDALVADVTEEASRGKAYGFQRSMDHAGAVLGPLVAVALLTLARFPLRQVFLLAAVPAAIVIVLVIAGVHEPGTAQPRDRMNSSWELRQNWADLGRDFKRLLLAVFVFTLGNSTDAFLLLGLSQAGVSPAGVAALWSLHHVIKMGASYYGGHLCDRGGPRRLILAGWTLYAVVYLAFGTLHSATARILVFMVYGIYYGLTEPCEKAWVAQLGPQRLRGTAFGCFNSVVGLASLPASLLFGWLWQVWGPGIAFGTGAALAGAAAALLLRVGTSPTIPRSAQ